MPKMSEGTGATFAGSEGIAQDAKDRLWQTDPSLNADGTVVDGYESDERELTDPEKPVAPTQADDDLFLSETGDGAEVSQEDKSKSDSSDKSKGGASSGGSSSSTSSNSRESSTPKTQDRK